MTTSNFIYMSRELTELYNFFLSMCEQNQSPLSYFVTLWLNKKRAGFIHLLQSTPILIRLRCIYVGLNVILKCISTCRTYRRSAGGGSSKICKFMGLIISNFAQSVTRRGAGQDIAWMCKYNICSIGALSAAAFQILSMALCDETLHNILLCRYLINSVARSVKQ